MKKEATCPRADEPPSPLLYGYNCIRDDEQKEKMARYANCKSPQAVRTAG